MSWNRYMTKESSTCSKSSGRKRSIRDISYSSCSRSLCSRGSWSPHPLISSSSRPKHPSLIMVRNVSSSVRPSSSKKLVYTWSFANSSSCSCRRL